MNNIFLDTNILVYAFDETSVFHEKSAEIFLNEDNNLFAATKNISEFFAVCSKLNLDLNNTFGFYNDLKDNCTILMPTEHSLSIFETLIKKYKPRGNRIYDIEIVSIMLANELTKVATANIDDFKNISEIEVIEIQ